MGVTAPAIELSSLAQCAVSTTDPSPLPRISMKVLLLAVGLACQHWIMLLAEVARTSDQLSETRSRLSKVSLIADLLRQCALEVSQGTTPVDEVALTTRYLSGSLRQRRTGIRWSSLAELPAVPEAGAVDADPVTVSQFDAVMQ